MWRLRLAVLLALGCGNYAGAEELPPNSLHLFAGRYTTGNTGESANPFGVGYEDNYLIAIAYAREFWHPGWGFHLGGEAGWGSRFGEDPYTAELWTGFLIRHRGFAIKDWVRFSFGCTVGISWVSDSMGTEAEREAGRDGDATWLFYLGPELSVSLPRYPQWELVYRLQHRSGAEQILGDMAEGHNANTLGLRYRF